MEPSMNWPGDAVPLPVKPSDCLHIIHAYATTDPENPEAQQVIALCTSLQQPCTPETPVYESAAALVSQAIAYPPDWAACSTKLQAAEEELNPPSAPPS